MYRLYCRSYQRVLKLAAVFLPWRKPELVEGKNSINDLPRVIKNLGLKSVLIVTDTRKITGIKEQDIHVMVERAYQEANPLYPVPKIFFKEDLRNIYDLIREKN